MTNLLLLKYDISQGWFNFLSFGFFKALWHTSVVIYGVEYYFGRQGINSYQPVFIYDGIFLCLKYLII